MEITKATFEAMLILLYKIDEYEACEALLAVYKKHIINEVEKPKLTLVSDTSPPVKSD